MLICPELFFFFCCELDCRYLVLSAPTLGKYRKNIMVAGNALSSCCIPSCEPISGRARTSILWWASGIQLWWALAVARLHYGWMKIFCVATGLSPLAVYLGLLACDPHLHAPWVVHCISASSVTFGNDCLASSSDFMVDGLEAWHFVASQF